MISVYQNLDGSQLHQVGVIGFRFFRGAATELVNRFGLDLNPLKPTSTSQVSIGLYANHDRTAHSPRSRSSYSR